MIPASSETSFEWRWEARTEEQRLALEAVQRFCHDAESGRYRWLSLLGKSGRGKTHLANEVSRWRCRDGRKLGRLVYRWLDILQDTRSDQKSAIRDLMARCERPRLMIIDDIGSGYETGFSGSLLAEMADRRLGKATVWTSNLSLEQIADLDSRIASRMIRGNSEVFTFTATPHFKAKD